MQLFMFAGGRLICIISAWSVAINSVKMTKVSP